MVRTNGHESRTKSILGEPTKVVNLGVKQIYIYKDMKVVLLRGKVADVQ